jgi:hypothetical protein
VPSAASAVNATVEGSLAASTAIQCGLRSLLLANLFVGHGARNHIDEELKVVLVRDCICLQALGWVKRGEKERTEISILDIAAGFPLGLHNVVALLGEILNEKFLYASVSAEPVRVRMERTVARVMTNAALFEHMLTSPSREIIFFTRDTVAFSIVSWRGHGYAYGEAGFGLTPLAVEALGLCCKAYWLYSRICEGMYSR